MGDSAVPLDLTVSQARVLGSLLEKELVTPDSYPTTLNALVTACNQTSNREPVLRFEPSQVETAALALKSKHLLRVVHPGSGERATRYRQTADELLELNEGERAVLCLLLLRGAQTAAELRARAERLSRFADTNAVETVLDRLAGRPEPLAARVERLPGQKEPRWIQLLEMDPVGRAAAGGHERHDIVAHAAHGAGGAAAGLAGLEERVAALEKRLEALVVALGDLVDLAPE